MEAIKKFKALKKLDKILDYFEKEHPGIMFLSKNCEEFQDVVIQTILDFHLKEGNKNFRYFPWQKKIKAKMHEMYG